MSDIPETSLLRWVENPLPGAVFRIIPLVRGDHELNELLYAGRELSKEETRRLQQLLYGTTDRQHPEVGVTTDVHA